MRHPLRTVCLFALLVLLGGLLLPTRPTLAANIVVSSTSPTGPGSLGDAIAQANANSGPDAITFNLSAADARSDGYWQIAVTNNTEVLPTITDSSTTIDATSQPGGRTDGGPKVLLLGPDDLDTNGSGFTVKASNTTIKGFIIGGFSFAGILVNGTQATGNKIYGNYIGTNWNGTVAQRNYEAGVLVADGASNNIIGGVNPGERNLISGNGREPNQGQVTIGSGIPEPGQEMNGNQVVNNLIGTDASGNNTLSGASHGVLLSSNAVSNTIGPGNVISGNFPANQPTFPIYGIYISGQFLAPARSANIIKGNIIGLNAAGTAALPNGTSNLGGGGIHIGVTEQVDADGNPTGFIGSNTVIGGSNLADPAERNVIGGHTGSQSYGILVDSPCDPMASVTIQHNLIGTNASGTAAIANGQGVRIAGSAELRSDSVPCNVAVKNNVISGNNLDGVSIDGLTNGAFTQPKNNLVDGNLIGTGLDGTTAIPNKSNGVYLRAGVTGNTINANLISGNAGNGILIEGASDSLTPINTPNANTISSNKIGTKADGTSALGNGATGVQLSGNAHDNVIGPGNIISGQTSLQGVGLTMLDGTTGNKVIGSTITANTLGVRISGTATGNSVGDNAGPVNTISSNSSYGVVIVNANNNQVANSDLTNNVNDGVLVDGSTGVRITHATSTQNGGNGIRLVNGGNGNRQPPTLTISGNKLTGLAEGCANCVVEIYTNDVPGEPGEGNTYLSDTTRTDASGTFSVDLPITGCKPFLVATVTDATNNTSSFSNQVGPVDACSVKTPGIRLDPASPSSKTVDAGTSTTYTHRLTNTGTAQGTYTVSLQSTQNWASALSQTSYTLEAGAFVDIVVQITVPANAPGGAQDVTTITASLTGGASVSQSDTTTVTRVSSFEFAPPRQGSATTGTSIDYTHYITNTGNASDTFTLSATNTAAAQGVSVSFLDCNPCTVAAGESVTLRVRVTVAASSTALFDTATITVNSSGGTSQSLDDVTTIQQIPVPSLTPATASASGKPGDTVTFVHTLTNAGNASGTFSVSASTPPTGWTFTVDPAGSFTLAPGETRTVTLTVKIPASPAPDAGPQAAIRLTASAGTGSPPAVANDTVIVLLAPAVTFVPDRSGTGAPGQAIYYTHYITNTGNGEETFNFSNSTPAGWSATVVDAQTLQPLSSVTLARNAGRTVLGQVSVSEGVATGVKGTIYFTATASTDPRATDGVTDTTTIVAAAVPQLDGSQTVSTDPGIGGTLNHTITNIGNAAGSFIYTLSLLPPGWTYRISQSPAGNLAVNGQAALTVVVTPSLGTPFGSYTVRLGATATDANKATTSVTDTVNVNRRAGLILAPPRSDLRDPDTVVTYTHTLTNSGNFTDTVALSASSSRPWAVRVAPASTTLAPGATQQVTVTLTIPPGVIADVVNTTTVTATSSQPGVTATVTDTTRIRAVPGVKLTPLLQLNGGEATQPVTFTFKLLNSGSVVQDYTLTATPPAGWTTAIIPSGIANIQPGQEVQIVLVVTTPAGTPLKTTGDTILRATSNVSSPNPPGTPPFAEATARLIVGPAFQVDIAPDNAIRVLPGQVYRYSHKVTNTGLFSDTFLLSTQTLLGWNTSVTPSSLTLPPGASVPVTVTVIVPTSVAAEVVESTQVTVRSASRPGVNDSATDTSTVERVAGVSISPNLSRNVTADTFTADAQIEFQHQVINTGNSTDRFVVTAVSPLNWSVTIVPTTTPDLVPGFSYPVLVTVKVPKGTPLGLVTVVTVRATSQFNTSVKDEAQDRLSRPPGKNNARDKRLYIPFVKRGS